jgi:predicted anti-sigma-YlaC factor YlaD
MIRGNSACKRIRTLLGVFVLGGLRGQEEFMVRTHLAGCAQCRSDYDELAEVPALLDLLTAEEAQADELLDISAPQKQRKRLR